MRLLPALTAGLVLALAPSATAAVRDPSGDYKPKALDIVAVGVSGSSRATVVDVRFRGNFERAMNGRALRRAAVAVAVAPADGGAPKVVVTSGRSTKPRDRRSGGLDAGFSFRHGRRLTFVLGGQAARGIRNLAEVAAARPQRARAAAAQDVIGEFIRVAAVFAGRPEANSDEDEVVERLITRGPPPVEPGACARARRELDRAKRELEKWQRRLDRARKALREERQHPSSDTLEHTKRLDELKGAVTGARLATRRLRGEIALLTQVLDEFCPEDQPGAAGGDAGTAGPAGPSGGPTPDEDPFAVPPEAMFTFAPNDPPSAPKAGEEVHFDGTASTPTGHISKYKWEFGPALPPGNGDPSPGAPSTSQAEGPMASVTFSAPGRYPVRLVVYDDQLRPVNDSLTRTVFVSGPGMKQNTLDFGADCSGPFDAFIEFYIPSYAETPNELLEKFGGCENVTITKVSRTIGTAPPFPGGKQRLDAWGRHEDTYRIEFKVSGQPTAGSVRATVNWK